MSVRQGIVGMKLLILSLFISSLALSTLAQRGDYSRFDRPYDRNSRAFDRDFDNSRGSDFNRGRDSIGHGASVHGGDRYDDRNGRNDQRDRFGNQNIDRDRGYNPNGRRDDDRRDDSFGRRDDDYSRFGGNSHNQPRTADNFGRRDRRDSRGNHEQHHEQSHQEHHGNQHNERERFPRQMGQEVHRETELRKDSDFDRDNHNIGKGGAIGGGTVDDHRSVDGPLIQNDGVGKGSAVRGDRVGGHRFRRNYDIY
ncbi:unnamed protein product [Bursaphelenchus okinawaensis]|uniref:Uncharacterized protein n=1 Tax=Bursaphelenchus okinawaensis TaxID=465554 RepID=A0A811LE70_9BILA|nr:unnamed protein product [Bursaphelenchus okinawaensis]CAG9120922.1 unnamed protein product [Bursaphelenchus okinawaensis]